VPVGLVIGGMVTLVAVAALAGGALVLGGSSRATPGPTTSPAAVVPSGAPASPALPAAPASPTAPAGGPLAEALVKALHHEPFVGHVQVTTAVRDALKATLERETATATGDVSGRDVDLHVTDIGGRQPVVDQEVVSVGDTAWIRPKGGAWAAHPRADVASSIDGLRTTIALLDDPSQLVDLGIETVDGEQLHHLTAANAVTYQTASGAGAYDSLDIWTTDAGVPVIAKGSFSAKAGQDAVVGSVDIRYSDIGKPVTIRPPAGAPTLAP
jgi:hypothetical protein